VLIYVQCICETTWGNHAISIVAVFVGGVGGDVGAIEGARTEENKVVI